jgi:hypothetical protein
MSDRYPPHQCTCIICGQAFESKRPKKYCSGQCFNREHHPHKYPGVCGICGQAFMGIRHHQQCCSKTCGNKYIATITRIPKWEARKQRTKENNRLAIEAKHQRTCKICGKAYIAIAGCFCSDECRKESARRKGIASDRAQFVPRQYTCRQCGETHTTRAGECDRGIFCSRRCKRKWSNKQKDSNNRQRVRRYGGVYHAVKPIAIFERDNWTCRKCGKKTPKRLRGTCNKRAPELDHIIPLSLGGSHIAINLQCLCRQCNGDKGAKAEAQLLLIGT